MKFSTKEDIEAPIEQVFDRTIDVQTFERSALRRGAEVLRLDRNLTVGAGSAWRVAFAFRGKHRDAELTITDFSRPNGYTIKFTSGGIEGSTIVELVPLSPVRTRLSIEVELVPRSIAARLLIQSLKLARSSLVSRFKHRIAAFAAQIEQNNGINR